MVTPQKKSKPKKTELEKYLNKTHEEINNRAITSAKNLSKTIDLNILTLDDSIKPILTVLCSDCLEGNHDNAINNAALLKTTLLGIDSLQAGLPSQIPAFDLNSLSSLVQNISPILNMAFMNIGSILECCGKNIINPSSDTVFQYGYACKVGSAGHIKSDTCQEIGICIGKILHEQNKESQYNKAIDLVKTLHNNRHRKRFIELITKTYNEALQEESSQKEEELQQMHIKKQLEQKPEPIKEEKKQPEIKEIQPDIQPEKKEESIIIDDKYNIDEHPIKVNDTE